MGRRSRAATKGLRPKKSITGAQRKARKVNIEIARKAKKKGTKKHFKAAYQEQRSHGMPKKIARNVAWGIVRRR